MKARLDAEHFKTKPASGGRAVEVFRIGGGKASVQLKNKSQKHVSSFGSSFSMPVGAGIDSKPSSDSNKSRFRNSRFTLLGWVELEAPIRERGLFESLFCFGVLSSSVGTTEADQISTEALGLQNQPRPRQKARERPDALKSLSRRTANLASGGHGRLDGVILLLTRL